MEWAHRAVINKQRATLESARQEAQAKEAKLELTIHSLRYQLSKLAEAAKQDTTLQPGVTEAEKLKEKAVIEVGELRHANNAFSNIIRSWHPA